jgi:hypothetical protein
VLVPLSFVSAEWRDGVLFQTSATNCSTTDPKGNVQFYSEPGTAAWVGYYGEPNHTGPMINDVYALHVVIQQVGNPCKQRKLGLHNRSFLAASDVACHNAQSAREMYFGDIGSSG